MARVYNFSAGPSMLPEAVLRKAESELLDYRYTGMSVMEMSHRSKDYMAIIQEAEASLRELMHIPENYKVLFLLRLLKSILTNFVDVFLVLYFGPIDAKVSNNSFALFSCSCSSSILNC